MLLIAVLVCITINQHQEHIYNLALNNYYCNRIFKRQQNRDNTVHRGRLHRRGRQ